MYPANFSGKSSLVVAPVSIATPDFKTYDFKTYRMIEITKYEFVVAMVKDDIDQEKIRSTAETAHLANLGLLDELLILDDKYIDRLRQLLAALDEPTSCREACRVLHGLARALECHGESHLRMETVIVPGAVEPIRLLITPAVFSPEQWGKTFAEGLLKNAQDFDGKLVAEIGTGSGWVGLLLLLRTNVAQVLGLDINPTAVLVARLNAWLNGTYEDGSHRLSKAGFPIPSVFRACVSDLLAVPIASDEHFDYVIGCIPQVLHPLSATALRLGADVSEKDLYDLSNYCFQQGILEDRFGLPLIARALEEAQLCLNSQGHVMFVLGGRPGQTTIEAVFRRRGFKPTLKWNRRIKQADDTDLASLVQLEANHGIKFSFFMSPESSLSICASTSARLLERGCSVYHDLLVYDAQTHCEQPTVNFVRQLHQMGLDTLREELDFSRITDEQMSFLGKLSRSFLTSKIVPYPHERGNLYLRELLARFLGEYCHTLTDPSEGFVGPERAQLVAIALSMLTDSGQRILLSQSMEPIYQEVASGLGLDVVVGNDDLSELLELDELLRPAVSIISPYQLDRPSPIIADLLCKQAAKHPERWYVVDDSANLEFSSNLNSNVLLRLTSQLELPPNLLIVYGLVRNEVYPDLELSFFVNAPKMWARYLAVGAELTYSRISYPSQQFYEWLLEDLLSFSFPSGELPQHLEVPATTSGLTESFAKVASDPIFAEKPIDLQTKGIIRLDYGEFEAPVPDLLVKGILKGFLEPPYEGLPGAVKDRIVSYLQSTRGISVNPNRIVLSQGVFPLFGSLVRCLARRLGRSPVV
ncbi:MAG: 50S ribosomal protein L11 methyltransferase, partial [Candidatus Melainabacteria bacterium]|nr:50S ribosomal protein L11 methyltransferase [Candidatus Melainabacteria bacterium]